MPTLTFDTSQTAFNAFTHVDADVTDAITNTELGDDGSVTITLPETEHGVLAAADQTKIAPSEEDVRAEAARRLILQFGARDRGHMERIILDGTREAVKLLRIGAANWTAEQATRAATLEAAEAYVDAIDAASKALRAMQPIPVGYADDAHWPESPGA